MHDDCEDCKRVQALEKELLTLLERSGLGPLDRANTLLLFALIELLQEYGHDGAKQEFVELATRRFGELDELDP